MFMRLRSGKKNDSSNFKKPTPFRSNASNVEEQSIDSTIGNTGTLTTVGENPIVISQITSSIVPPEV